jgi:hypothetical protein
MYQIGQGSAYNGLVPQGDTSYRIQWQVCGEKPKQHTTKYSPGSLRKICSSKAVDISRWVQAPPMGFDDSEVYHTTWHWRRTQKQESQQVITKTSQTIGDNTQ